MPLTKKIIEEVVRNIARTELVDVKDRINRVEKKVDNLTETVTDFAGQLKKFDEEQTVLSDHVSNRTDRIEKLEVSVFGTASV